MIAAALLASLALAQEDLGTRPAGADWPGFLGPTRDGQSPERGLQPWPADGPRLLWQRDLGEGYAACSIRRGRLFQFDRHGSRYRLDCLKSETGELLWSFAYETDYADGYGAGNGPRCCPVVDEELVYTFDPAGVLHAIRITDGKPAWRKNTAEDYRVTPNFFGVGSTPLLEGDLLIVHVGGAAPSGIVAFDKRSGAEKYRISDELAGYSSPTAATIQGRRWGFVFARGGLVGFEPATGKIDFTHPWRARAAATVNIANPVVVGDLVFVSEAYAVGSSVVRVRPGGCDVVWQDGRKRDQSLQSYWNTPIHAGGFLYGANGMGSDGDLRCVELATGKVKWISAEVKQCSLLGVDGHLVGLGEDGTLWLIKENPERCEILARTPLKLIQGPARAAPVLSHGLLYLRGTNRLLCLELLPARDDHPLSAERRARLAKDLAPALASEPKTVQDYSARGDARFMSGAFKDAVVDYEKMVELDPALDTGHWRRGIAQFYAGQPEKAARQFEIYHSFDNVDRENGIWRYFSQYKAFGREKAREGLLKYAKDDREPFPDVYQLFEGKRTPGQILAKIGSAEIGDGEREQRYFYAHLYIGLNLAIENKPAEALPHLRKAVENRWGEKAGYGPNYMWHVGRLHYDLLRAAK